MLSLEEKKQNVIIVEWSLKYTTSVFIIQYFYISEQSVKQQETGEFMQLSKRGKRFKILICTVELNGRKFVITLH